MAFLEYAIYKTYRRDGDRGLWTAFAGGGDALVIVVERGARNRLCI